MQALVGRRRACIPLGRFYFSTGRDLRAEGVLRELLPEARAFIDVGAAAYEGPGLRRRLK